MSTIIGTGTGFSSGTGTEKGCGLKFVCEV